MQASDIGWDFLDRKLAQIWNLDTQEMVFFFLKRSTGSSARLQPGGEDPPDEGPRQAEAVLHLPRGRDGRALQQGHPGRLQGDPGDHGLAQEDPEERGGGRRAGGEGQGGGRAAGAHHQRSGKHFLKMS